MAAPLLIAGGFGLAGPPIARRLPPAHATWMLSAGAAITALSVLAIAGSIAVVAVAELPVVAARGHWSPAALESETPFESWATTLALIAALASSAGGLWAATRQANSLRRAFRDSLAADAPAGICVVADGPPRAMAVPGRPGIVLVSQSLLGRLDPAERAALIAHERAHLRHGHHWHRALVEVAAAINPLLRPVRGATILATERWADEEAARRTGRSRTARALARAALLRSPAAPASAAAAMAAASERVSARVIALMAEPVPARPGLLTLVAATLAVAAGLALAFGAGTENVFEYAGRAYRSARP